MKKDIKELLPLIILDVIGVVSIIINLTNGINLSYKFLIGIGFLIITSGLFFINRKSYKYFLFLTLILSFFDLISFSSYFIKFGFSFVEFQFSSFLVLLLYIFIFKSEFKILFNRFRNESKSDVINNESLKNKYKEKFTKYSMQEIESNLKLGYKLVPEAIEALEELKKEKSNN